MEQLCHNTSEGGGRPDHVKVQGPRVGLEPIEGAVPVLVVPGGVGELLQVGAGRPALGVGVGVESREPPASAPNLTRSSILCKK